MRARSKGLLLVQTDKQTRSERAGGQGACSLQPPRLEDHDSGTVVLSGILTSKAAHCVSLHCEELLIRKETTLTCGQGPRDEATNHSFRAAIELALAIRSGSWSCRHRGKKKKG